jgi:large subunit ribosomal protein L23
MKLDNVIKRPVISEKSMSGAESICYAFIVNKMASKGQIKMAVEKIFGVHVVGVRTLIIKKKQKRLSNRRLITPSAVKKAIVELKKGEKLNIYEN